jgi:hypothetical protein
MSTTSAPTWSSLVCTLIDGDMVSIATGPMSGRVWSSTMPGDAEMVIAPSSAAASFGSIG